LIWRKHARISAGVALLLLTGCNESSPPVIGKIEELPSGDTGCWLYPREVTKSRPVVFFIDLFGDPGKDIIRMNINGKDVHLTQLNEPNDKIWEFKADNLKVTVELGPITKHESRCGVEMFFPKAKMTVTENNLETVLPVSGQCGCMDP
jgi:hypothetical protein